MTINDKAAKYFAQTQPASAPHQQAPRRTLAGLARRERQGQESQSAERERLRGDNAAAQRDAQKTIQFQK